jgi:hypothetical protein
LAIIPFFELFFKITFSDYLAIWGLCSFLKNHFEFRLLMKFRQLKTPCTSRSYQHFWCSNAAYLATILSLASLESNFTCAQL